MLIIGCGDSGVLTVPDKTRQFVESQGIQLIAAGTSEACNRFNELIQQGSKVVAGLHLTC